MLALKHPLSILQTRYNTIHVPSERFDTLMNSGDTTREILISIPRHREPSIDYHVPELLLIGEPLYALDEVLVRVPVASNNLADERDRAERPALIEGVEKHVIHGAELEAREDAAGLQHAVCLAQGSGDVGEVANAKCAGVSVDRGGGDGGRQRRGIRLEEGEGCLVGDGEVLRPGAADGEHGGVDVRDGHVHRRVGVGVDGVAEEAEGDIAGAAGNVEEAEVRGRV